MLFLVVTFLILLLTNCIHSLITDEFYWNYSKFEGYSILLMYTSVTVIGL